jgi:DNA-directed RNA polymerase subunit RPC12/RpoP
MTETGASGGAGGQFFPCPNCGGQLEWDPSHQEMRCPYCDSLVPVPSQQEFHAREHDLLEFLEQHPKAEGYGVTLEQLSCRQCGATIQVPPGRRDLTCPFCASAYVLEDRKPPSEVIKPESLIPFQVDKKRSQGLFKDWLGRGWFRPNDLRKLGALDRVVGLYLPFFTFDALAQSAWTALAGYYYYVTERVAVTNDRGERVWENRQVRKVRWEPASGQRSDRYDDVLVPAVQQERMDLVLRVYPFDTSRLMPYSPSYLAGFGVLNPDMPLKMVYQIARSNMEADQVSRCSRDVPGDTQRDLSVRTTLSEQTFKHLLCPLWLGSFRYKGKVYPCVVNGQTGRLYGDKPWSWAKISLALGAAALFALLFYLLLLRGN